MQNDLKPCPFCGGIQLFVGTIAEAEWQDEDHPGYQSNSQFYTVCCDYQKGGCGASIGGGCFSMGEAIESWNRRVQLLNAKQNKEYTIILSKSQIDNLIEFFDFQFIDSIKNDIEVDNIAYVCDMCDIYQSLKKTIENSKE